MQKSLKAPIKELIFIQAAEIELEGLLEVPPNPIGLVLFAHGSGSSRHSRRNNYVASLLKKAKIATLLFDLLTDREEADRTNVFDIELLSKRLINATDYVKKDSRVSKLPFGYFGASTGAAAALNASTKNEYIKAIVSRGGRPDLAEGSLSLVKAPTLLIVGGNDFGVIELNERAYNQLACEKELTIVHGATHLFEEPGKLEEVAKLARNWFVKYLKG
ncbi:dienelactone hydrolase family protein [Desulfohalobiaceae bacterium Ax17]|uniref:dienelactone hydrolase family protein n=1 Tax=Desulfovulcanus ferrireducens TaxID=2831190 RepID=UPI00207BC4D9|nr:dienelactone hydrolase family protein [Desulfovulcanus ferrireducens]MBT8763212.1 dienelactone hydrolase family protein [Desulfovulcanus ferrireducens]